VGIGWGVMGGWGCGAREGEGRKGKRVHGEVYLPQFFTQRVELGEEYLAFFMVLSVYFFPPFA
jgi:hypothetical protein